MPFVAASVLLYIHRCKGREAEWSRSTRTSILRSSSEYLRVTSTEAFKDQPFSRKARLEAEKLKVGIGSAAGSCRTES